MEKQQSSSSASNYEVTKNYIEDDNNDDKTSTLPSTSKQDMECKVYQVEHQVKDSIKGIQPEPLRKDREELLWKLPVGEQRSNEHDYEQLRQRLETLIYRDKKLYDEKDPDPLYWGFMGSEYSSFTDKLIEVTSNDQHNFNLVKEKYKNAETIRIKRRIKKAYELLLMTCDCYNLIHDRIREFRKQHTHKRYCSSYFEFTTQDGINYGEFNGDFQRVDYEKKIKIIKNKIEDLNNL